MHNFLRTLKFEMFKNVVLRVVFLQNSNGNEHLLPVKFCKYVMSKSHGEDSNSDYFTGTGKYNWLLSAKYGFIP